MKCEANNSISDAILIREYLDGNAAALEILYQRYRLSFYSYFNRMLNGDTATADDLFQELWIKIIDSLARCRDREHFSAWAFAIARNELLGYFRKKRRLSELIVLSQTGDLPEIPTDLPPPDTDLNQAQLAQLLEEILPEIPPAQREVFELRRAGLSFREIAALQKCPLNTALSRMRYVILSIQRKIEGLL